MNKTLLKRVINSGVLLFKRSGMLGVSSISVTVVTLTVILGLFFSQALLDASLRAIESRVDVTIYIADSASEETINTIQKELEAMPEVKSVEYVSREEALVLFRERHASDDLTLQALDEIGKNPLPASFVIHAKDTAQYENIITTLEDNSTFIQENKSFITKVNFSRNKQVIDKILLLRDGVKKFGYTLTLIFIIIAIMVTFNTVRLATFTMKDEIEVMRLVGAKGVYIRGPFIVAQIIYSLIASIITLVFFLGVTYLLRDSLTTFFGVDLFVYYIKNIFEISGLIIVSGLLLGITASFASVTRYLRK
jgi:cell division transport system permease protein